MVTFIIITYGTSLVQYLRSFIVLVMSCPVQTREDYISTRISIIDFTLRHVYIYVLIEVFTLDGTQV